MGSAKHACNNGYHWLSRMCVLFSGWSTQTVTSSLSLCVSYKNFGLILHSLQTTALRQWTSCILALTVQSSFLKSVCQTDICWIITNRNIVVGFVVCYFTGEIFLTKHAKGYKSIESNNKCDMCDKIRQAVSEALPVFLSRLRGNKQVHIESTENEVVHVIVCPS